MKKEVRVSVERTPVPNEVVVALHIPFERMHLATVMGELLVLLYLSPEETERLLTKALDDYACLAPANRLCSERVA